MKKFLAIALALVLVVSMVACGKKDEPKEDVSEEDVSEEDVVEEDVGPSGDYVLTAMKAQGQEVSLDDYYAAMGEDFEMVMTFNDDGTGTLASAPGVSMDFTWEGNTYTADGQTAEFELDGDVLTIIGNDGGESTMTFEHK